MNKEFHYYIVRLVAARAGLRGNDLRRFAYSSQFVDDNTKEYNIHYHYCDFSNQVFINPISQTMVSNASGETIYKTFHFVPGDFKSSSNRKDGRVDPLAVIPNSDSVNRMIDYALSTGNIYLMGIAAHAYTDSWAHQNFTGEWSSFNGEANLPSVGHMLEGTKPDRISNVWHDRRLIDDRIANVDRFLDAATALFKKLFTFVNHNSDSKFLEKELLSLRDDLLLAVGDRDDDDRFLADRIGRYKQLALTEPYGGVELPDYDKNEWFDAIVKKSVGACSKHRCIGTSKIRYFFLRNYKNSEWYLFQSSLFKLRLS
jgi:hypothetical protein